MKRPDKTDVKLESPSKGPPGSAKPFSDVEYYTSSVKLFHTKDCGTTFLTSAAYVPMPGNAPIPGFVCKAARVLLGQTQEWLSDASNVSRKTIFDFEAGDIEPKIGLNNRLRTALEEGGAHFVCGESVIGVFVYTKPAARVMSNSR
ncbi:MAG TPA: hypothetical protein VGO04_09310 [Ensifer sp.]|uniref:helix-turn-helix transcriptional regulator n=1 Tax=Ensifer sp. TaxID=1872086 RepID=UPI002E0F19A5|nr:hypothetical protein [Ensifer sp.]